MISPICTAGHSNEQCFTYGAWQRPWLFCGQCTDVLNRADEENPEIQLSLPSLNAHSVPAKKITLCLFSIDKYALQMQTVHKHSFFLAVSVHFISIKRKEKQPPQVRILPMNRNNGTASQYGMRRTCGQPVVRTPIACLIDTSVKLRADVHVPCHDQAMGLRTQTKKISRFRQWLWNSVWSWEIGALKTTRRSLATAYCAEAALTIELIEAGCWPNDVRLRQPARLPSR